MKIKIIGASLAGLTLANILARRMPPGTDIHLFERRSETDSDAGSGMSVIGHALRILERLGVQNSLEPQDDVTLRLGDCRTVVFNVPLFGLEGAGSEGATVQCNAHRGELVSEMRALLPRGAVTVHWATDGHADGGEWDAVVFADGVNGAASTALGRTTSGYTCWRGMAAPLADDDEDEFGTAMFKTVAKHAGSAPISFTTGVCTKRRRFWVVDCGDDAMGFDAAVSALPAAARRLVARSRDIITTRVVDRWPVWPGRLSWRDARTGTPHFVIGDAARPMQHHFGQGGCCAVEDAARLAQCLLDGAGSYGSFSVHHARASVLVLASRLSGFLYMSPRLDWLLLLLLRFGSRPFTALVSFVLFSLCRDVRKVL